MSDFIQKQLRTPNIPIYTPPQKIKLTKNDVSLQFLMSADVGKTYRVTYIINITPNRIERDPSIPLSPVNVDMASLKNSIMNNVNTFDKRYMTLINYDTRRAIFDFEYEKWLRDSVSDADTTTKVTRFARTFRMRNPVPSMIAFDPMRVFFEPFIIRKFKEYMEKGNKGVKWFKHLLPDITRSRMRSRVRDMFDWEYNFQWNFITATLKPLYIMAIIYAVGMLTKSLRQEHLKSINSQQMFATKVYSNLKQFDYGKFDKYSERKGFV